MNETLIFGIHAVENALKSGQVTEVWVLRESKNKRLNKLKHTLDNSQVNSHWVSALDLDKMCTEKHQGVVAKVSQLQIHGEKQLKEQLAHWEDPLLLILDSIEDPRNLGACLRSADAAGVTAVVITKNQSAPITAVTRTTAAGAVDHLALFQVSNLARAMESIKQAGVWIYGTDCSENSQSIYQTDLTGAVAIVVGNEGKGMRHLVKEKCDHLIHIPMAGEVQSLNVSVATGVTLFEVVRQRSTN